MNSFIKVYYLYLICLIIFVRNLIDDKLQRLFALNTFLFVIIHNVYNNIDSIKN